jgi:hypothetical protein
MILIRKKRNPYVGMNLPITKCAGTNQQQAKSAETPINKHTVPGMKLVLNRAAIRHSDAAVAATSQALCSLQSIYNW